MTPNQPVFIDSVHLIGMFVEDDQWHRAARAANEAYADRPKYISEGIFQEFLAHVSRHGSDARRRAANTVRRMRSEPSINVVSHSEALLEAAIDLYDGEFAYTALSLQDCVAIQIMRAFGIDDILTADQEFALAGLTPLLLRYA